jgi:hypothetical protein
MHVEPLRNPGSIALRRGIDADFEVFAMNHYSTYINLVRAHDKIQVKCDHFRTWIFRLCKSCRSEQQQRQKSKDAGHVYPFIAELSARGDVRA